MLTTQATARFRWEGLDRCPTWTGSRPRDSASSFTGTGIRPEKLEEYKALHANPPRGVLDGLRRAHVSNYSIFVHGTTLFGYLEYDGDDFERDMAELARDPVTQQWWSLTDPCQFRLPEGDPDSQWTTAESVFFMA